MEERRASQETHQDMLGYLMGEDENRYKLTDEEIIDQIIAVLYSGYETVSTTTMMTIKYLHDHPRVLQELRVSVPFRLLTSEYACPISFQFASNSDSLRNRAERTFGNQRSQRA